MTNVAFIINPFSAKKNYQPFLKNLHEKIDNPLYYLSESVAGTEEFIKDNYDKVDLFVAVGGDGTISSVAKKLINSGKTLAIFPAGSGNGFSNETNFSANLDELLEKIRNNQFRKIDTFMVNDLFSINVSGTGFDGKVVKAFEKTTRGFGNYIKVSIRTFFSYRPVNVTFKSPDFQIHNGNYLMVNVANTRQFGNNAYIAPHASTVDGLAEIVLVKKFPFWYGCIFAINMFTKNLKENDYVTYLSVPEIEFSVTTEDWHLDGEFQRIKSPVKITVLPNSLKILV